MSEKIDHFLNRMVKWNRGSSLSGSTLLKHLPSFLLFPVFQRWSWDDQSSSSQSFIKKSAGKLVEIPGVAIADLCNQISKPLPWVNKTGYRLHLCTFWIYRSFSPPLIFFFALPVRHFSLASRLQNLTNSRCISTLLQHFSSQRS